MNEPIIKRWVAAWLGGAAVGVGNGVLREATYGKQVSEYRAHQISVLTAIAGFGVYFWRLQRRWALSDRRDALLADYNLIRGRTWPLVLLWLWRGPAIIRGWQGRG